MKPLSIRFQCFGPYLDEQFIDFTQLETSGLFLICGETGAGKTTILDAICYALYNQSSGNTRGKGLAVMRCKQAQKSDITLVEFVFSCGGKRYKFRRTLEFKRKNIRDEHQCWEERDGEFVPLFENPKDSSVTAKAQALIGLTYDQFRQVIILPQGQFEKLLISDSDEKEKILVTLFHASRWQRMADELYRRVKEQDTAIRLERQQCDAKLSEYNCTSTEALTEQINVLQERLMNLHVRSTDASARALALQTEKEQAMLVNEAFQRLHKQQQILESLLRQEPVFDQLAAELQAASAAQAIGPQYDRYRQLGLVKTKAEAQRAQCLSSHEAAQIALTAVQKRRDAQTAAHAAYEETRKQHTLLESKLPIYTALQEQKCRVDLLFSAYDTQKTHLQEQETLFSAAHQNWMDAQARQADAIAAYQQAQSLYLQGIGSVLAQSLEQGKPCPVCGSLDHPSPAAASGAHITEAQLEQMNQAMKAAADCVSAAAKERQQAEEIKNQALDACHKAQQEALAAQNAYDLTLEQRIEGIETLNQLNSKLQSLQKAICSYEQEEQQLQQDLQTAVSSAAAASSRLDAAEEALTEAAAQEAAGAIQWQDALASSGFATQAAFEAACMDPAMQTRRQEELTQFHRDLIHARNAVQEQQTSLSGQTPPDVETLTQSLKAAQTASQSLQSQLALENDRLERMNFDCAALEQRLQHYADARNKVDADLEFAERLRGSRGLSLQRYVLGVMLSSITAEANRLLKNVYGGRYQLFRSQDLGDRRQKSGLDLEVLDRANGQRRSVKTLSGGEKFLVALSLAIGLSTVVQAQGTGVRLEAMFIDEGFGSLDRDAISDALEILDGIRKGSGLVGIISHVEQLAENIPAKIEVHKGKTGSTCVVKC